MVSLFSRGLVLTVVAAIAFPIFGAHAGDTINDKCVRGEVFIWNRLSDFGDMFKNPEKHRTEGFKKEWEDFYKGLKGQDPLRDDDKHDPNAVRKPARQLGRGVSNLLIGWLEIPKNMHRVTQESGGVAGATTGFFAGVWRGGVREVVGVLEIVTFPMGWPPIVEPEFPMEPTQSTQWRVSEPVYRTKY